MCSLCSAANFSRSGMRAMVPAAFIASQMTPAGLRPASRARSTLPSVWPARTSTPPLRARRGKTWPGRTRSSGDASGLMAALIVVARSAALMPVVTPRAASMLTVNAVEYVLWFSLTIMVRPSRRTCSSVRLRQMSPRAFLAMKLIASGVTNCAASTRSPSFSRSASSTRMTMRPLRSSSSAFSTRAIFSSTSVLSFSQLQEARDVLGEDIGLDVHARAHRLGGAHRLPDAEERDAIAIEDLVHRQRDPVHRDGPFLHHQPGKAFRQPQFDAQALADDLTSNDLADAVDVAEHQMAAQPVAQRHGSLEVDAIAGAQGAQRAPRERLSPPASGETPGPD